MSTIDIYRKNLKQRVPEVCWDELMPWFGTVFVPRSIEEIDLFVSAGFVLSRREARQLQDNLKVIQDDGNVALVVRMKKGHPVSFRFCVREE